MRTRKLLKNSHRIGPMLIAFCLLVCGLNEAKASEPFTDCSNSIAVEGIGKGIAARPANQEDSHTLIEFIRAQRREIRLDPDQGADGRSLVKDLMAFADHFSGAHGRLFMAFQNGKLVGTAAVTRVNDDECELKKIYVDSTARGMGLGGKLLDLVIHEARARDCRAITIQTRPEMSFAVNLYERRGFQQDAQHSNDSVLVFRLPLRGEPLNNPQ